MVKDPLEIASFNIDIRPVSMLAIKGTWFNASIVAFMGQDRTVRSMNRLKKKIIKAPQDNDKPLSTKLISFILCQRNNL